MWFRLMAQWRAWRGSSFFTQWAKFVFATASCFSKGFGGLGKRIGLWCCWTAGVCASADIQHDNENIILARGDLGSMREMVSLFNRILVDVQGDSETS